MWSTGCLIASDSQHYTELGALARADVTTSRVKKKVSWIESIRKETDHMKK